jgi:hypothetical protein
VTGSSRLKRGIFLWWLVAGLVFLLAISLFFVLVPQALREVILALPIPGNVRIPAIQMTPQAPLFADVDLSMPVGHQAYQGLVNGTRFSCGFLLELDHGQRVGVNAAHSVAVLPRDMTAEFRSPDGSLAAVLSGQIAHGQTFIHDQFTMDYVLWAVTSGVNAERFLHPDPRGAGQPGEPVLVYSPFGDQDGGPKTFPGVVMSVSETHIWIQMQDSFTPSGFSGCPVISRVTGKLIGMAVAGANQPPVVMGLHPVRSLVEKTEAAFSSERP